MKFFYKMVDDGKLIESIIIKDKNPKPKNEQNTKTNINRIIDYCKSHNGQATKNEIEKNLNISINSIFLKHLSEFKKLIYSEDKEIFQLHSEYNLRNINDLKSKIRDSDYGLLEDEQLKNSYLGIEKDLEILKNQKFVRVIYNTEKKMNVLFFRDMDDPFEKKITDPKNEEALKEIRKTWNELDTSQITRNTNYYLNKKLKPEGINNIKNQNNNVSTSGKKKKKNK